MLALVLIVAPLCVLLYGVLTVAGALVQVVFWPTKVLLLAVASVLGGWSQSK